MGTLRHTRGLKAAAALLASVGFGLVIFEVGLEWALDHSALFRDVRPISKVLRNYHRGSSDWKIMQYEPDCTRHDRELSYTLRPGGCSVADREYAVRYDVNQQGLRDDAASLVGPRIVVLGDSYAMGWGVEQQESFPERIERDLGVRVLNAGISSYGTAREMLLLERLGLRGVEVIVVQYCNNDDDENRPYVDDGRLDIQTETEFDRTAADYRERSRRYFGKHLVSFVQMACGRTLRPPRAESHGESERYFFETLRMHAGLLAGKVVIVVPECTHRTRFIDRARAVLAQDRYREIASVISFVDAEPHLDWQNDFFLLDSHLTPSGHARYAALIEAEIARRAPRLDGRAAD